MKPLILIGLLLGPRDGTHHAATAGLDQRQHHHHAHLEFLASRTVRERLLDESGFPGLPGAAWHQWGHYPLTPNSGNKIRYNLFERFLGDRWDGGAIYTMGQQGHSLDDPC